MAKLRKATEAERTEYWGPGPGHPVYQLYGFVDMKLDMGGMVRCAVEDLRGWPKDDPQYEIMAPDGYTIEDCHSRLCMTLKDVRDDSGITLERCDSLKCECGLYWAGKEGRLCPTCGGKCMVDGKECATCKGTGVKGETCATCAGTGIVPHKPMYEGDPPTTGCSDCEATGHRMQK